MKCPRCHAENPAGTRFCGQCAAPFVSVCPSCGASNPPENKFCGQCAVAFDRSAQPRLSPEAYTPKHLAEKILTSKSALEGERKQVTILFCDIVESTRLAERLDPETMHELMDRALRLMAEAVHRYEGTVNQFLGDGLMALFGAPVAVEDHALRAVQAALAIRETLGGYSEQLKLERGVEIQLRIGLNTGLVVVGRIGDDLRMDYTAVGDATNLAARLQALAEPGGILVAETTHRLIEGYVRSEALGPMAIKGLEKPVAVFRITGRRRARRRFDVMAERGLTPLAGRDRELQLLRDCLVRVKGGRGQTVAIVGEAGVGKSRLLHEFRRSLEGEKITWLEGHCTAYGQAAPYLPVLEVVRITFGVEEGDNQLQIEEKLRQGVRQLDGALEWVLPFLGELLTSRVDPTLRHLEPKEKRKKTFEAFRALTAAGAHRRPLIIIQEDLHWIDNTSEDYLAFLVDSLTAIPALLVTTHRPGYSIRWADKTYHRQITLNLLGEREVETMVTSLLGTGALPAELLRIVHEKAEGNPLFVEEITTSLQERGVLVPTSGGVTWARSAAIEFPATVQDIIRARLDRLEDRVKRTAQTAAVIGREFGLGLLARISELSAEVQGCLETLTHVELIHEKRFFPEMEYVFKHAVIQDVAYQSLLLQRRKDLHTAIGAAIEQLYVDRLDEQASILAHHYARSHQPDRAVEYALLAGDRAAKFYANAEAATYYEEALRILGELPSTPRRDELRVDATVKLASVAITRQHFARDLTNLEAAHAVVGRLDDRRRTAQVLYWIARTHYVQGHLNDAIQFAERSLAALGDTLPDDDVVVWPINLLGRIYTVVGDYVKATAMLQRCVPLFERLGNLNELATASGILGVALAATGEFPEAFKFSDQGLRIAQEIQNLPAEAANYYYRAWVSAQKGNWGGVLEDCRAGLAVAERIPDPFRIYSLTCLLGHGQFQLGQKQQGLDTMQHGIRLAEELGTTYLLAWAMTWLCESHLAQRDWATALVCGSRALSLAATGAELYGESLASRCYGEALCQSDPGRLEEAEGYIRRAIAIQEERGMKPQLARSYVASAHLFKVKGEGTRVQECLDKARALFGELDMQWDLQRLAEAFTEV
jgi:class 3 adenylate cyclase/tetratricopeptide (TPR) repeat protein